MLRPVGFTRAEPEFSDEQELQMVGGRHAVVHLLLQLRGPAGDLLGLSEAEGEFGFDPVQLGLIGSAFAWVYAAGAPLAGFIADRVSRKG